MNSCMAFVFPGQGSQHTGMLSQLYKEYPVVIETFAQASDVLGYDLWQLVENGPENTLNSTEKTQPAILTSSVAIWRIWHELHGATPKFLAGHSLGEYSALVCANVLDFKDAVRLVAARGRFMQEAVPEGQGAMAVVVGLSDQKIQDLCLEAKEKEVLEPANYNSIGQVVTSGDAAAVERFIILAKKAGAKLVKPLPVSVPSHCSLMKIAAKRLAEEFQKITFRPPVIPVINNVDVTSYSEAARITDALARQLYNPVRWVETIQYFSNQGIDVMVECGPGKVLSGLNKRISAQTVSVSVNDPDSLQYALNLKKEMLAD